MTIGFFLPRMESKNLFLSLLLCYSLLRAADSYMVIEEKTECNLSRSNKMNLSDLPPISIVDIHITSACQAIFDQWKKKRENQRNAQPKISPKPRPTPAADCVPNFKTCKPRTSCCNYCALCKCRIFQTICQCLILNPKC
ncbi:Agouti-signaling protein [Apaloderma vittatum]|uniref:Agouti-signaling protein n=1 Tax=Apaloderma vittatum TaxID=57397 RepID=A0A091NJB4_APAVI|nr:Agouti-signaling protein [Apaloderma vittatum]